MNYKVIRENIKFKYDEIFNLVLDAVIDYMKNNAVKENMFIETLYLNVSDWDIELENNDKYVSTIDKLYYIPATGELGFIVYKEDSNNIFKERAFSHRYIHKDLDILMQIFNIFCK